MGLNVLYDTAGRASTHIEGRRVLILVDHYPPAFKAGGPTRSIPSIIRRLSPSFRFIVITSNRDAGERHPLEGVTSNAWSYAGQAMCLYLSAGISRVLRLRRGINDVEHDVIYLNSVFSIVYTLTPLLMRRLGLIPRKRIAIAPRGELAPGALGIRRKRKVVYLWLLRRLGLITDVVWHATSRGEEQQIRKVFGPDLALVLASNMSSAQVDKVFRRTTKVQGALRAVFISRVSRKKNLDFALAALAGVRSAVVLHVYGPIEDARYWRQCRRLIANLPPSIEVQYLGTIQPDRVIETLKRYELFVLPTLGENYGHAIAEAFLAGCPVLISDQTPWRGLTKRFAGWDLPLSDIEKFRSAIDFCAQMSGTEHARWADGARSVGLDIVSEGSAGSGYLKLFGGIDEELLDRR